MKTYFFPIGLHHKLSTFWSVYMYTYVVVCVYIYIYAYVYTYVYFVYLYIYKYSDFALASLAFYISA